MAKKILIIDDSKLAVVMVKDALEKSGYQVLTAMTGEEGVETAKTQQPDLVIVDTVMPGLNGFEVCQKIKEQDGQNIPKVIVVTGSVDAVNASKARQAGADGYSVKTSDVSNILEEIRNLI
ncbi:MAG: DNA-binding response OmpR family regulator [Candidatus Omnitrophota bacterium]|jgi:DNA-binding response OmpR family regulator